MQLDGVLNSISRLQFWLFTDSNCLLQQPKKQMEKKKTLLYYVLLSLWNWQTNKHPSIHPSITRTPWCVLHMQNMSIFNILCNRKCRKDNVHQVKKRHLTWLWNGVSMFLSLSHWQLSLRAYKKSLFYCCDTECASYSYLSHMLQI